MLDEEERRAAHGSIRPLRSSASLRSRVAHRRTGYTPIMDPAIAAGALAAIIGGVYATYAARNKKP